MDNNQVEKKLTRRAQGAAVRRKVCTIMEDCLLNEKPYPTLREMREKIGTGSMTTIAQAMQGWRDENVLSLKVPAELTPEAQKTLLELVWKIVQDETNRQTLMIKRSLTRRMKEVDQYFEERKAQITDDKVNLAAIRQQLLEVQRELVKTKNDKEILMAKLMRVKAEANLLRKQNSRLSKMGVKNKTTRRTEPEKTEPQAPVAEVPPTAPSVETPKQTIISFDSLVARKGSEPDPSASK